MAKNLEQHMKQTLDDLRIQLTSQLLGLCDRAFPSDGERMMVDLMKHVDNYTAWCALQGMLDGRTEMAGLLRDTPPAPGPYTRKARAREEQRAGGPWQVIEETYRKRDDGRIAPPDAKPIAGPFAEFGDAMAVQERLKTEADNKDTHRHAMARTYGESFSYWPWVRYRVRRARADLASPVRYPAEGITRMTTAEVRDMLNEEMATSTFGEHQNEPPAPPPMAAPSPFTEILALFAQQPGGAADPPPADHAETE